MFVSIDALATVISFAGLLVALAGGFGWMIRRMDAMSQRLDDRIDQQGRLLNDKIDQQGRLLADKIDEVDHRLGDKIDGVRTDLGDKIEAMGREITEVKIAVARLEGPRPHLISPR